MIMDIEILHEEKSFLLCKKPVGVLSQGDDGGRENMVALLSEMKNTEIFPVHRLDLEVGGVMVYAKSPSAASRLSAFVSDRRMEKRYLAVVHGVPEKAADVLKDLLFKDSSKNKSFVVKKMRKGVKEASLEYETLETVGEGEDALSLLRIKLHTGRTHQIRVQFSSRGLPLVGDRRYGSGKDGCDIALFSENISFPHPFVKGKDVRVMATPNFESYPWSKFSREVVHI